MPALDVCEPPPSCGRLRPARGCQLRDGHGDIWPVRQQPGDQRLGAPLSRPSRHVAAKPDHAASFQLRLHRTRGSHGTGVHGSDLAPRVLRRRRSKWWTSPACANTLGLALGPGGCTSRWSGADRGGAGSWAHEFPTVASGASQPVQGPAPVGGPGRAAAPRSRLRRSCSSAPAATAPAPPRVSATGPRRSRFRHRRPARLNRPGTLGARRTPPARRTREKPRVRPWGPGLSRGAPHPCVSHCRWTSCRGVSSLRAWRICGSALRGRAAGTSASPS